MKRARQAWGANPPDWIVALAAECDRATQTQVGAALGCSPSAVNQVLSRSYQGRMDRFESKVRGRYMKATVPCPVLGDISTNDCFANQVQAKKFKATNPLRRALFTACKSCPNREKTSEEARDAAE